jgi:hypothetical protein
MRLSCSGGSYLGQELLSFDAALIAPVKQTSGELSFVAGAPDTGFPAHIAERFPAISFGQRQRIIGKTSELEAELAMGKEANDHRRFNARGRTGKEFGKGLEFDG